MTIAEGTRRVIEQVYTRHECECCGEPATKRHSFLLENARNNPASFGYRKDDISWCADDEAFTCDECKKPTRDGMECCATFPGDSFPHMTHFFREVRREDIPPETPE